VGGAHQPQPVTALLLISFQIIARTLVFTRRRAQVALGNAARKPDRGFCMHFLAWF